MNSWIFEYTSFLLISHNCVIIPGLGGFIRNSVCANYDSAEHLLAPSETVIFNQDLKHDDGLLTSFCQNKDKLSYEHASKKIKTTVERIKIKLNNKQNIDCYNLGLLSLSDEKTIIFNPNTYYIHPSTWGFTKIGLNTLTELQYSKEANTILLSRKNSLSMYIAAAIALILFFLIPSVDTGFNHNEKAIQSQQADVLLSLKKVIIPEIETTANFPKEDVPEENKDSELITSADVSERTYYIVIGSETSASRANILLNKLKNDSIDARILQSSGRYRIYTKTFSDKSIAESYLESFRSENFKYKTAWLLSLKNK